MVQVRSIHRQLYLAAEVVPEMVLAVAAADRMEEAVAVPVFKVLAVHRTRPVVAARKVSS